MSGIVSLPTNIPVEDYRRPQYPIDIDGYTYVPGVYPDSQLFYVYWAEPGQTYLMSMGVEAKYIFDVTPERYPPNSVPFEWRTVRQWVGKLGQGGLYNGVC